MTLNTNRIVKSIKKSTISIINLKISNDCYKSEIKTSHLQLFFILSNKI